MTAETKETLLTLFKDLTDYQKRHFLIVFGPIKSIPDKQIPRALQHALQRKKVNTGEASDDWWN